MKKLFVLCILILLASCSDFLTVEPREEVSITEQFSTYEGVKQALNGVYYETERWMSDLSYLYPDLVSGNLTFTPRKSGSSKDIVVVPSDIVPLYNYNETAEAGRLNSHYNQAYAILNNVNNILKFINEVNTNEDNKRQVLGEALAMRAFIHYELVKKYAQHYGFTNDGSHLGIVYADKVFIGGVDYPSRSTVKSTYNTIKKDLENVLQNIGDNNALNGAKYSMVSKNFIYGLLAQLNLESGEYKASIDNCNNIFRSGIALTSREQYINEWKKVDQPINEVILELTPPKDDNIVTSSISEYFKVILNEKQEVVEYGSYVASSDLVNLLSNADLRRQLLQGVPLPTKVNDRIENKLYQFSVKHQDNAGTMVLRLSEIILIAAEAYARDNDPSNALQQLNIIKSRAGIPLLTSINNLLEEIFLERRRELHLESKLLYDLARFKKDILRNTDCLSTTCTLKYPNSRYILPIPRQTIDVNPNMKQNEGY